MSIHKMGSVSKAFLATLIIGALAMLSIQSTYSQEEESAVSDEVIEENETLCLHCHSKTYFSYVNIWTEDTVKRKMCEGYVITPEEYYSSNHKTFLCADCHSEDFATYPHNADLRMMPKYECLDCHGGDEYWAKYQFEKIYDEYAESVHAGLFDDGFSCWSCHDAHEYHISARTEENIRETIAYDNAICLSCHADLAKYQLVTSKENPNILTSHDWLPNQNLHFSAVRCIECHTAVNDSMLVAHKILPGSQAVRKCVECHSSESRLLETLYRYEKKEKRSQFGFVNGVIVSENSYLIGANRNVFLNYLSIIIFGFTLLAICIHVILRLTIKK